MLKFALILSIFGPLVASARNTIEPKLQYPLCTSSDFHTAKRKPSDLQTLLLDDCPLILSKSLDEVPSQRLVYHLLQIDTLDGVKYCTFTRTIFGNHPSSRDSQDIVLKTLICKLN